MAFSSLRISAQSSATRLRLPPTDLRRRPGLDVSLLEGLHVADSVQWSSERMQLLGSVEGDTLVVSSLHQG